MVQIGPDAPELPLIAGAPAQVARLIGPDLVVGGIWILPEQGDGVHHEAGVAETALLGALVGDETHELRRLGLQASNVQTLRPSARAVNVEQDSTGTSLSITVHRPHADVSQPRLTLLHPWARTKSISSMSAGMSSTTVLPFSLILTST